MAPAGHLFLVVAAATSLAVSVSPASAVEAVALPAGDRAHARNALLHHDRGNHRDAILHAARAGDELPAKLVRWLLLTETDGPHDFDEAREFFEQHPDWPRRQRLQRAVERSMPPNHPDADILAWFDVYPPTGVDGAITLIGALLRDGQTGRAEALIRDTWRNGDFDVVSERNFLEFHGERLGSEDHIARLDRLLWNRSAAPATALARRLGRGYPELAAARLALAARADGVPHYIARVPAHLRDDPGLVFERASWRMERGLYEGVLELLLPLEPGTPQPGRWWPVRQWAVHETLARDEPRTAYRLVAAHGLHAGPAFAEAEWLTGWIAFDRLGDPVLAYPHFARLHDGSTGAISRARGAFWAAEAAAASDDAGKAMQWYQTAAGHGTAFYGQMAALRLGIGVQIDPLPPPPDAAARANFARSDLARAARLLGQLGQRSRQAVFLQHLGERAQTPEEFQLAVELATSLRRVDLALTIGKHARNAGAWVPDGLFPRPTLPGLVETPAEPALVLAVIRQESAFDPRVVSPAGAAGLMQLMPATATAMAGVLRASHQPERLLSDPAYNIRLGGTYLQRLLERYDGDVLLTAAAYNAGPGRVAEWTTRHGDPRTPDTDPITWIERIPFAETRNYVMRVLESLAVYRLLEDGDPGHHPVALR